MIEAMTTGRTYPRPGCHLRDRCRRWYQNPSTYQGAVLLVLVREEWVVVQDRKGRLAFV